MFGVFANANQAAFAADDLAVLADFFDGSSDFHNRIISATARGR